MRKIVAGLFVSVDGVVEAPDVWTGPYFSPEVGQLIESMMADRMNNFDKVVVSTTLDKAEWQNSTLISGNVAEEITRLKQRPGRNINMSGSGTLAGWLLGQGLLDEFHLLQFPVV